MEKKYDKIKTISPGIYRYKDNLKKLLTPLLCNRLEVLIFPLHLIVLFHLHPEVCRQDGNLVKILQPKENNT